MTENSEGGMGELGGWWGVGGSTSFCVTLTAALQRGREEGGEKLSCFITLSC